MKRILFAMMVVAASLMVSCGPDNGTEEPINDGRFNKVEVFDLGDFDNDGHRQFILQISYLNEDNAFSRLMSAHIVTDATNGKTLPEGTFQLREGDYKNEAYFDGSFYVEMTEDKNAINYILITDGTIKIEKSAKGHIFTVNASGWNYDTGDAVDAISFVYEDNIGVIADTHYYKPDFAMAVYFGNSDGGIPYWNLQLDDHSKFVLQFYVNTYNESFMQGIPSANYEINGTDAPGTINAAIPLGGGNYWGSLVFKVLEDETMEPQNLMIGGNVNIVKKGDVEIKQYPDGTEYGVCDYEITIVFYNGSYVPYTVSYTGEIILWDNSVASVYETYAYLMYYGGNKWCIMYGEEEQDYCAVLYAFADANTSFEGGLDSGVYNVDSEPAPWDLLPSGTPYTIAPGQVKPGTSIVEAGHQSSVYNYECTSIYDVVTWGKMTVDNKGNNNYKIDFELGGGLGYVEFSTTFEGEFDIVSDNSKVAPAQSAIKAMAPAKSKSPLKGNINKGDAYKFNSTTIAR